MNKKIEEATYFQKKHEEELIRRADLIKEDPGIKERMEHNLCKTCFYKGTVLAGQAFTSKNCELCNSKEMYPTTYVDKVCMKCAKENNCCKHCMSSLKEK